jgi:hypothetical protein
MSLSSSSAAAVGFAAAAGFAEFTAAGAFLATGVAMGRDCARTFKWISTIILLQNLLILFFIRLWQQVAQRMLLHNCKY